MLSPAELLRRGEGEMEGADLFSPAELLLEKGQKDLGDLQEEEDDDEELLSRDNGTSLQID